MSSQPHDSVKWAIEAWGLRENYLPRRQGAGLTRGFTEMAVTVISFELVRTIELDLKARLQRHLAKIHGHSWWNSLPAPVRRSAQARHRWATLQLGSRRTGTPFSIHWLSLGDVIKALRALSLLDWQLCLRSEASRRSAFERCLRRVKIFRDYELAHRKPKRIGNQQLRAMCNAVRETPAVLCPQEWDRLLDLLSTVARLPRSDQERLINGIDFDRREKRLYLRKWLACPALDTPESCAHAVRLSGATVSWRLNVLSLCTESDAGRRVFFSYGELLAEIRPKVRSPASAG